MKKFWSVSVIALFLIVQACKENESAPTIAPQNQLDEQITFAQAQQIFDAYQQNTGAYRISSDKKFEKKPKWDYAQKEKFVDGKEVVIVPVDTDVADYEYAVLATDGKLKQSKKQLPEVFTTHKVVVYKDKGKDKVELLSVIGEENYKSKHTYFDSDKEFTGTLLFRTLEGDFLRGFYYQDGKRVGILEEPKKNPKNGRPNGCYIFESIQVFYFYVTIGNTVYPAQTNGDVRMNYTVVCDGFADPVSNTPGTYNAGASGGPNGSNGSSWSSNGPVMKAIFEQKFIRLLAKVI